MKHTENIHIHCERLKEVRPASSQVGDSSKQKVSQKRSTFSPPGFSFGRLMGLPTCPAILNLKDVCVRMVGEGASGV